MLKIQNYDDSLELIFNPKTVAVYEAKEKISYYVKGFKRQGFNFENLFLISPTLEMLAGVKCYESLDLIPTDTIDLLILSVRREFLIKSLQEILSKKKVKFIHIFTAGTGEADELGVKIEKQLQQLLNQHPNTRAIGPNCMGLYSPRGKIAYYPSFPVEKGNIGLIFQSGDLHSKLIKFGSRKYNLRFSMGVSIGNCIDIQISEFLQYFNNDEETDLICVYFEGISPLHVNEGKKLLDVLKNLNKPVLFMRGGRTKRGQTAVLTHTGAMATKRSIWDAIFKQTNIIEVPPSLDELLAYAYIFSNYIKGFKNLNKKVIYPKSKRTLMILWSGGFGILATDILTEMGLELPYFEGNTLEKLKRIYPITIGSLSNPLDLPWIEHKKVFLEVSKAAIDENIDLIIVETDAWGDWEGDFFKAYYNNLFELKEYVESLNKIFIIVLHQYPSKSRKVFYEMLIRDNFLVYPTVEAAAQSFLKLFEYGKKLKKNLKTQI
ncbi:MAG: CoA-binding protein [Candidatus Hodarchaeota archaeon]